MNLDLIRVPKSDPSAKDRYIYYQNEINTLPSSLSSFIRSPPIFKGVLTSALKEPFIAKKQDPNDDESIYSFVSRRFGDHVALNLVGAMTHGIYAGDIKQLSVKSTLFRTMYDAEQKHGSVVKGLLSQPSPPPPSEQRMMDEVEDKDVVKSTSVFGFKEGTETLTRQLKSYLAHQPNVTIVTGRRVRKLEPTQNRIKVFSEDASIVVDHVISAIPSRNLDPLVSLPHLTHNPAAHVTVANFAYTHLELAYKGFGFLTPHPDAGPSLVGDTLGVVFDSNAMKGQDKFTKLTVMMRGNQTGETAQKALEVSLGITQPPDYTLVNSLKDCIPQYLVGHESRLVEMHHALQKSYPHLLSVAGASYLGVSVPDCVKHSRLLVQELLDTGALGTRSHVVTGLNKLL